MKTKSIFTRAFIGLMTLVYFSVGIQGLFMPSELLAVVGIPLDNPSALSSIRGIYGGLHIAFGAMMLWSLLKNPSVALLFVVIYTGGFTLGRWTAFALDGQPNAFVTTWMFVEPVCGLVSWFLWSRLQQKSTAPRVNMA